MCYFVYLLFYFCLQLIQSGLSLPSADNYLDNRTAKEVCPLFVLFICKLCQFSFTMYHVDVFICVKTKPTCFCVPCQNFAALKTFITTVFTLLQPAGDSADYEDMADDIIEFESSLAGVCFFIFIVIF